MILSNPFKNSNNKPIAYIFYKKQQYFPDQEFSEKKGLFSVGASLRSVATSPSCSLWKHHWACSEEKLGVVKGQRHLCLIGKTVSTPERSWGRVPAPSQHHGVSHSIFTITLQGRYCFHSHFTGQGSEAQKGEGSCLRPHKEEQQTGHCNPAVCPRAVFSPLQPVLGES